MEYSFEPFLDRMPGDWFGDDPLLGRLLARFAGAGDGSPEEGAPDLSRWGEAVAGPLRSLARESARPENRPRLRHRDAHDRRVDEIWLPGSTREALRITEGAGGLGALHGDPFVFYSRVYLTQQNGEAGVACSMACTDGLVRALEALGDEPMHRRAVEEVRGSDREGVCHGAQFVTEIQGGSDVPANELRAEPDVERWRLHGQKWFCSNINADYFLVTARPEGAPEGGEGVGLFLVPAYREGRELRNGYTVDRLKEKLGTRELATAEVTFDGARAWQVGPVERGIPNLVRHVLVPSRFACVISAAAFLRSAQRIVEAYTEFRTAFGRSIGDFPLVRDTVSGIRQAREESLAAVFGLLELWERSRAARGRGGAGPGGGNGAASVGREAAGGAGTSGRPGGPGREAPSATVDFRVMLSLAKPVLTRRSTRLLHEAMMLLGGNGIEEEFSPLPRLHRDAVIMETWEGPHNVLLTQALRDLRRFEVDPGAFVERLAGTRDARPPASPGEAARGAGPRAPDRPLAEELARLLDAAGDPETTVPFARWADGMVRAFGRHVLEQTP